MAAALLMTFSCNKYVMDGADYKTLTISYGTSGNSIPSFAHEGGMFTSVVVVNQGGVNRDVNWVVSVDNAPDWVSVQAMEIDTEYVGTYGGDDREVTHKGVSIIVEENNSGAKRTAVVRYTVADGSSISTVISQAK